MIPKIIWQTYETEYNLLPKNIKKYRESWINKYPQFKHNYMSANDRNIFVLKYFGKEWHDIFINLPYNIMRADIWRHMVLYVHGGIYFDLDMSPIYKIEEWLKDEYSTILFGDTSEPDEFLFFYQAMASEPGQEITKSILDHMFFKFNTNEYKNININSRQHIAQYSGEIPFKIGIKKILDPLNLLPESANHHIYNNLDTAKKYKFHCYGEEYDIFSGNAFKNIDGANNWTTGYNSWWKEVEGV